MFDDLVLLAKGGFTVYHGPARRVEEYFAELGINVPERVNPPDHFIDILEGIVTPNADISYEELPVRWLLHNGYPVPADLQQNSVRHSTSTTDVEQINGTTNRVLVEQQPSLAGELWQGMRSNVEEHHDKLRMHWKTKDLSNRKTPGILKQYRYFLGRYIIFFSSYFQFWKRNIIIYNYQLEIFNKNDLEIFNQWWHLPRI